MFFYISKYNKQIILLLLYIVVFSCNIVYAQNIIGRTDGKFEVSQTGGAIYSIPIDIRGNDKFNFNISLVYNSHSGNSIAGYGWGISGLSVISATPKSLYYDGMSGGITLNDTESYLFDGEHMILLSGKNGQVGSIYTTEAEKFVRISIDSVYANTPKTFTVRLPNGSKYRYGSSGVSLYDTQSVMIQIYFTSI